MQSYIKSAVRRTMSVLSKGFIALVFSMGISVFLFSDAAHALTISVGTPTVVTAGITVDDWTSAVAGDSRIHVVYSTSNATTYTIMYASNTSDGGYTTSVLSTGAVANKPSYLNLVIDTNTVPHTYYYDASSNTVNYLIGTTITTPKFLFGSSTMAASMPGLNANAVSGNVFTLLYSSVTNGTNYNLMAASVTLAPTSAGTDTAATYIQVISTTNGSVASGHFNSFINTTDGLTGVLYHDKAASSLQFVTLSAGSATGLQTIDTGSTIKNINVSDASQVTRIAYTNGTEVKYAIQRRLIAPNCWYIEKVDDGNAMGVNISGSNLSNVSYVKSSNALWLAKGQAGVYYDDFSESITNAQQGKAALVSNVTKGQILQAISVGNRPRGVFQPNSTGGLGLNSINWVNVSGQVTTALTGVAVPSVVIRSSVTAGTGGGQSDLNPASVSNAGGLTNGSGNYQISVASGSSQTITPSSGSWLFVSVNDERSVSSQTVTTGGFASGGVSGINFNALYVPTILNVNPATVTVTYNWGNTSEPRGPLASSFTATADTTLLIRQFTAKAGAIRFAPTAASFSGDTTTGTLTQFNASALTSRHIAGSTFSATLTQAPEVFANFLSLAASTDSTLPLTYQVVYTTQVFQGLSISTIQSVSSGLLKVNPMKAEIANVISPTDQSLNSSVVTSTSSEFQLISLSSNGLSFPRNATGGDPAKSVGQVYLTTTTSLALAPSQIGSRLDLAVISSTEANVIRSSGSIFGLNIPANTGSSSWVWYVRVSTQINGVWHSAISPAVSFSTPQITAISINTNNDQVVVSSMNSVSGVITGSGLISGTTIHLTTSTTFVEGLPQGGIAGRALVSAFTVQSSTWATVTFTPHGGNSSGSSYYVYIATAMTIPNSQIAQSTVIAASKTQLVSLATAAVSSVRLVSEASTSLVTSTAIANTRTYSLAIQGWGLINSTVSFTAVDGSSVTTSVAGTASADGRQLTASVNFAGVSAGKYYSILIATNPTNQGAGYNISSGTYLTGMSNGSGGFTGNAVWVSLMSISTITTPVITGVPNGSLYNSTGPVTLLINGAGFVENSSVTFQLGSVNFSTAGLPGSYVGTDGRTLSVVSVGTAATSGLSTGLFGASAGLYNVTVTSSVLGSDSTNKTSTAQGTLTVLSATATAISANNNTNYSTLSQASFTITGAGLMSGATAILRVSGNANITSNNVTTLSSTQAVAVFDLRSATAASSSNWAMDVQLWHQGISTAITVIGANTVTISTTPSITAVSPSISTGSGGGNTLTINGQGLANGATVLFTFTGTAGSTLGEGAATLTTTDNSAGTLTVDPLGKTGTVAFPANKAPGTWKIRVSTTLIAGSYTGAGGAIVGTTYQSPLSTFTYTVSESSAPNAPTGLIVVSTSAGSVNLRWIAPGNDGVTNNLTSGGNASKFIIYYSTGEDIRGQGCAACKPVGAVSFGGTLAGFTTNYTFANTWAQFLPVGAKDSVNTSTEITLAAAYNNFSTATVKGLTVSTLTFTVGGGGDATLQTFTSTSASTGVSGSTSIIPGTVVGVSLNSTNLKMGSSKSGTYWFIVRAMDESGNYSSTSIVYSTVTALIPASAAAAGGGGVTVTDTIDPNTTTNLTSLDLGGGVTQGGSIPPGSLTGSDTLQRTSESSPPTATVGVTIVGGGVNITLASGKTEFLNTITLTFTLSGAALSRAQGVNAALVKLAYFNGTRWVVIADSSFSGGVVTARITHLTTFAVVLVSPLTNLNSAMVYPNPFRPSLSAHFAQGITFDQVPANTTIRIYTLAGDLVKDMMDETGAGVVKWDGKNNKGQDVASGVYFVLMKSGGETRTLKLAIQR